MRFKCVLFDLDGTVLDTNELILESFRHTYNNFYRLDKTDEEIYSHYGETLKDTFAKIDPHTVGEAIEFYRDFNFAKHDEMVKLFPGVKEALEQLKQTGIKMGVVTSKLRYSAEKGLKICGIRDYFDVIISVDDVPVHKPNPEPVLKALEALNCSPEAAAMVGDSPYDILAAQNAHVYSVGVEWSVVGKERLKAAKPNLMIKDFRQLTNIIKGRNENG